MISNLMYLPGMSVNNNFICSCCSSSQKVDIKVFYLYLQRNVVIVTLSVLMEVVILISLVPYVTNWFLVNMEFSVLVSHLSQAIY